MKCQSTRDFRILFACTCIVLNLKKSPKMIQPGFKQTFGCFCPFSSARRSKLWRGYCKLEVIDHFACFMFYLLLIQRNQSSCVQLTEQLENKSTELLLLAQSQECQREELNKVFHIINSIQILTEI